MSLRQPQPRENHAAVGVGKKLFVWAGDCGSSKIQTTTVESFDVSSGTWEQPQRLHGSLPDGLYGMAVASDGENAYSFGGRSGSHSKYTYYNTLYEINLSTFECNELVPRDLSFAPKKKKGSGMVLFESKLVIHGGYTGQDWTDDLHVFDIRTSECMRAVRQFVRVGDGVYVIIYIPASIGSIASVLAAFHSL